MFYAYTLMMTIQMNKLYQKRKMGGIMRILIAVTLTIIVLSGACASANDSALGKDIGLMPEVVVTAPRYGAEYGTMPEVVVTAPRYEEDSAYSGMMPEIVVTAPRYTSGPYMGAMPEVIVSAPRYEGEDIAYSGMMPEIVVTAPAYGKEDIAQHQSVQDMSLNLTLMIIKQSIRL
jgi:ABC-type Fe3+-hydroxamate transport system substrate-binding protein